MPTPPRNIYRRRAWTQAAIITLGAITAGCGETYINEEATATTAAPDAPPTTTLPPVDVDASPETLLTELADELSGLSEEILDKDQPEVTQSRVNEIWAVLEPKLDEDPSRQTNVGLVVDFANLAVDRKRPADADKASKLLKDVIDAK